MAKKMLATRGIREAQEQSSVAAEVRADSSHLTGSFLHDSMVESELNGSSSVATEMEVDVTAPDEQGGMKLHECERCGPHVCTWSTVPTADVPPEVYATVGLTLEFESALEKMSEFVFHFHQALHLCIVTQNKENMPRIMMSMANFVEHIDEEDTSYSNLLDLSMLRLFSIIEMDGEGVNTQNRVFEAGHDDFMFEVLLEFPFEDLKKRICDFIEEQPNLREYNIHTYIADNLHQVPQKTDFSPAKTVARVCNKWPDNVQMPEFIIFHVKRYRIMKDGRQALDRAARP